MNLASNEASGDADPGSPARLEAHRCACGQDGGDHLVHARDRLYGLPGEYAYVRCPSCGLVRLRPRPTPERLAEHYPDAAYYSFQPPPPAPPLRGLRGRLRSILRRSALARLGYPVATGLLTSQVGAIAARRSAPYGVGSRFPVHVPGGRALDVGCGNASFLALLARHGWRVEGVDTSARAAEVARAAHGIDVFVGELWDAPWAASGFDYVCMAHVIEHVDDPGRLLEAVERLLRPGGRVFVETPNVDSWARRRAGEHWVPWEAPRHLFLFTDQTLRALARRAGLRVDRSSTVQFGHLEWEETYRDEARSGALGPVRPRVRPRRRPVVLALGLQARVRSAVTPMDGDILRVWATKPAGAPPPD